MNKRMTTLFIAAAILLIVMSLQYFERLSDKKQQSGQASIENVQTNHTGTANSFSSDADTEYSNTEDNDTSDDQTAVEAIQQEAFILNEKIEVENNTPEYELEMRMCEDRENRTFIRLQYYLNGVSTVNELEKGELSELSGTFETQAKTDSTADVFRIGQALLNPVHSQLYILIQGVTFNAYTQTSLYLVELGDMSVEKLFSYPGIYGKMTFNKDFSKLAYSFGDPPYLSNFQEDNLLEVFDCKNGEYIVKANRDKQGNIIGTNSNPAYLYDYEFTAWQSVHVLKLKQALRLKSDLDSGLMQNEVLYDIEQNLLLNTDGSEQEIKAASASNSTAAAGTTESEASGTEGNSNNSSSSDATGDKTGTGSTGHPATDAEVQDSEPLKVLKSFYTYLRSEQDYAKGMELLHNDFKLRLSMLKQFGADEITKNDINSEDASLYSELLKTAKFDTIEKEVTGNDISTVTYYQILGLSTESQIRQLMSAQLKKSEKVWKIILIEDGIK